MALTLFNVPDEETTPSPALIGAGLTELAHQAARAGMPFLAHQIADLAATVTMQRPAVA